MKQNKNISREMEIHRKIAAFYAFEKEGLDAVQNKYPDQLSFVLENRFKTFHQVRAEQLSILSQQLATATA